MKINENVTKINCRQPNVNTSGRACCPLFLPPPPRPCLIATVWVHSICVSIVKIQPQLKLFVSGKAAELSEFYEFNCGVENGKIQKNNQATKRIPNKTIFSWGKAEALIYIEYNRY